MSHIFLRTHEQVFPKLYPSRAWGRLFQFSTLRSFHLVSSGQNGFSFHSYSVFQSQTMRHTVAKTGLTIRQAVPLFCLDPRVMLCSHPSCHFTAFYECSMSKSTESRCTSNFLKSTTLPLFILASASQMQSNSEALQGPRDRKVPIDKKLKFWDGQTP